MCFCRTFDMFLKQTATLEPLEKLVKNPNRRNSRPDLDEMFLGDHHGNGMKETL